MRDVYYRDRDDSLLLSWALGIIAVIAILAAMFFFMNRERDIDVTSIEAPPVEQVETTPAPTIIEQPVVHEVPVVVPVEKPVVIEKPVIHEVEVPAPSNDASDTAPVPPAGAGGG